MLSITAIKTFKEHLPFVIEWNSKKSSHVRIPGYVVELDRSLKRPKLLVLFQHDQEWFVVTMNKFASYCYETSMKHVHSNRNKKTPYNRSIYRAPLFVKTSRHDQVKFGEVRDLKDFLQGNSTDFDETIISQAHEYFKQLKKTNIEHLKNVAKTQLPSPLYPTSTLAETNSPINLNLVEVPHPDQSPSETNSPGEVDLFDVFDPDELIHRVVRTYFEQSH